MVRETRYLWVGNLPEKVAEDRISVQFARHGKIQSVKLLPQSDTDRSQCAVVAFMDIKSAAKAHNSENKLDGVVLQTQYSEPTATGCSVTVSTKPDTTKPVPPVPEIPLRPQDAPAASIQSHSRGNLGRYTTRPVASDSGPKPLEKKIVSKKAVAAGSSSEAGSPGGKLGLLIRRLPSRSTDSSIRDGLFHEYKKHGKVTSVSVIGQGDERHAVVSFKKPEDASKAYENSLGKTFFGSQIIVEPHEGFEVDDMEFQPPEAELDEYHHKATRTLFVGNLEKDVDKDKLRQIFHRFGYIIDIDIKNQGNIACYAFVQYDDIKSVVQALHTMDGEYIGNNKIKLGFGKSMPTNCVWIDGVDDSVSVKFLSRQFARYGPVSNCVIDKEMCRALIFYDSADLAQRAVNEMRGRAIAGKKIQIDFASRDCQILFYDNLERTSQLRPGDRPVDFHIPFGENRGTGNSSQFSGSSYDRPGWGRGGVRNFRTGRGGSWSNRPEGRYFDNYNMQDDYNRERRQRFPGQSTPGSGYGSVDDGPYDDYGQELREYGYTQRDRPGPENSPAHRRDSRAESPFSRSSRFTSPSRDRYGRSEERTISERFNRDTDSQSGERESVRSFRSGDLRRDSRQYDDQYSQDRYVSEDKSDRDRRAVSPSSSEYSLRSRSPRYRRRSASPASVKSKKHKDKLHKHGSRSPEDYYRDSRTRSPSDYSHKSKDMRSRKSEYKERYDSDSERRPRLGSKVSRVSSNESLDKHGKSRRTRDADMSQTERSHSETRPRKRTLEEYFGRQKSSDGDVARQRRLERQVSRSLSASSKDRTNQDKHLLESGHGVGLKPSVLSHASSAKSDQNEDVGSGSTTSGSKTPMDSDQESFGEHLSSHSSGEVTQLEKEKLHLLSMLQKLDDTSSTSEAEEERGHKKPRIEDVFDLERDPSLTMKKWRETARMLEHAGEDIAASQTKAQAAEAIQEKLKALDSSKFKPIDTSQSFRKQMEALRKGLESDSSKRNKSKERLPAKSIYDDGEEGVYDSLSTSPRDMSSEFISKKRRKIMDTSMDSSAKRSYRTKQHDESFGASSDGEEGEYEPSSVPTPVPPPTSIPDLTLSLKDEILARKQLLLKSESAKEARSESVKADKCASRSRRDSRDSCSMRSSSLELRTDNPRIIPDSPVDIRGPDGKLDSRRIPQEPRTMPDNSKKDLPMWLPLPKFAKYAFQNSNKPVDKALVSPKTTAIVQAASPQVSPAVTMMSSPPFSPAIRSPQMSPGHSKVEDQAPPPPPPPAPPSNTSVSQNSSNMSRDSDNSAALDVDNISSAKTDSLCDEKDNVVGSGSLKNDIDSQTVAGLSSDMPRSPLSPPPPPPPPPKTPVDSAPSDSTTGNQADTPKTPKDGKSSTDKHNTSLKTPEKADSDSDTSDLISPVSPGRLSLDERIRALDEKLNMTQTMPKPKSSIVSSSSTDVTPSSSLSTSSAILDYREKYRRRKRESITGFSVGEAEPSPITKSILSRSTIFDQDSWRLEQSGKTDNTVVDPTAFKLQGILKNKSPPSSAVGPIVNDGSTLAMLSRQAGAPEQVMYHQSTPDLMSAAGYPMLNPPPGSSASAAMALGYNYYGATGNRSPAYSAGVNCNPMLSQDCISRQVSVESLSSTPLSSGRPCDPRRAAQEHMRMIGSRQMSPVISPGYPQQVVPCVQPDANKLTVFVAEPYANLPQSVPVNNAMSPPILKKQDIPPVQDTAHMTVSPAKPSICDPIKTKEINSPPIPILKKEIKEPSPDRKSSLSGKRKASDSLDSLNKVDPVKAEKKPDVKSVDISSVKTENIKCEVKKERKHESSSSKSHKDNFKDSSKKHSSHSKPSSAKPTEKKSDKESHSADRKSSEKKKDSKHHDKSKSSKPQSSKDKPDSSKVKKDHDSESKGKDKSGQSKVSSKSDKEKTKSSDKEKCDKSSKHDKHDKKDRGDDRGKGFGSSKHSSAGPDGTAAKPKPDSSTDKPMDKAKSSDKSREKSSGSGKTSDSSKQSKESKEKHEQKQSTERTERSEKSSGKSASKSKNDKPGDRSDKGNCDKSNKRSKSTDNKHRQVDEENLERKGKSSRSNSQSKTSEKKSSPDKSRSDKSHKSKGDSRSNDKKNLNKRRKSSEKSSPTSEKSPGSALHSRKMSDRSEENRELKMLGQRWDGNEGGQIFPSMYDMVKSRSNKERTKDDAVKKSLSLKHKFDELSESRRRRSKLSSSMDCDESSDFDSDSDDSSTARDTSRSYTARAAETKICAPKHPKKHVLNSSSSSDSDDGSSFPDVKDGQKAPTKKKTIPLNAISDDSLSDTTDTDSDFSPSFSRPKKTASPKSNKVMTPTQSQPQKKKFSIYTSSSSSSSSDLSSDSENDCSHKPIYKSNDVSKVAKKTKEVSQKPSKSKKPPSKTYSFTSSDSSNDSDSDIVPSVHDKSRSSKLGFISTDEETAPSLPPKPKLDGKSGKKAAKEEMARSIKPKVKPTGSAIDSDSDSRKSVESFRKQKREETDKKHRSGSESKRPHTSDSLKSAPSAKAHKKVKKETSEEKSAAVEDGPVSSVKTPVNALVKPPLETKAQLKAKPQVLEDLKRPDTPRQERASLFEVVEAQMESPILDQPPLDKELYDSKSDQMGLCWNVEESRTPAKTAMLEESDSASIVSRSSTDSRPSCITRSDNIFEKMELKEESQASSLSSSIGKQSEGMKSNSESLSEITPFDPVPDKISLISPDPEPCTDARSDTEKSVSCLSDDETCQRVENEHVTTNEEAESIVKLFEQQCKEQMKEMSPAVVEEEEAKADNSQESTHENVEEEPEYEPEQESEDDKLELIDGTVQEDVETKSEVDSTCNELVIDESSSQEEDLPQLVVETVVETHEDAVEEDEVTELCESVATPLCQLEEEEAGVEEVPTSSNIAVAEDHISTATDDDGPVSQPVSDDFVTSEVEDTQEVTTIDEGITVDQTEQAVEATTRDMEEDIEKHPEGSASTVIDSVQFSSVDVSVDGLSAGEETEEARDELNAAIENLIEKHLEPTIEEQQEQVEIQTVEETIVPPEENLVESPEEQVVDIVEDVQIEQAPSVEVCCEQPEIGTATQDVVDIPTTSSPHYEHPASAQNYLDNSVGPDMSLVPDMYKGAPTEPQREPVVLRGDQLEDNDNERSEVMPVDNTPTKSPRGRGRWGRARGRGRKRNEDSTRGSAKSPASESFPATPNKDQAASVYQFDPSKIGDAQESSLDMQYHNDDDYSLEHDNKAKGGRKARGKGRKGNSPRRESRSESEMSEDIRSTPRTPTRGSPRNIDPGTPPTPSTPPSVRRRLQETPDNAEKFSSRGRKIIPKERDGEISPVTRKSRKSSAPREGETSNDFRRSGSKDMSPADLAADQDLGIKKLDMSADGIQTEDRDGEDRIEERGKRTRRRSQRIGQKEDTDSAPSEQNVDITNEDADSIGLSSQERVRKTRKQRARKGTDGDLSSPRRHDGDSTSPRTNSPKASPIVKLEKLPMEYMREDHKRDDSESGDFDSSIPVKDLYAWEDDDEKPLPEYTHTRPISRKRKAHDEKEDASDAAEIINEQQVVPPHPLHPPLDIKKPRVSVDAPAVKVPPQNDTERDVHPVQRQDVTLPPKKDPLRLAEAQQQVAPDPLQMSSEPRHLPLKLEMKKQAADAAAAKAKALAEEQAAVPSVLAKQPGGKQWQPAKPVASHSTSVSAECKASVSQKAVWESNMDKVISDVAKGIFDRGSEYNYYTKMRERTSRDEPLSPREKTPKALSENVELVKSTSVVSPISLQEPLVVNTAIVGPHTMASPHTAALHSPSSLKMNRLPGAEIKSPPAPITPASSPKIQSPPAQASPAPSLQQPHAMVHTAISSAPADLINPMLALQKAGYPVSAQEASFLSGKQAVPISTEARGKAVNVMPRPVHIGVVSSHAYNRESSPLGQMIEKVPNPHLRLGPESEPRLATSTAPSLQQHYRTTESVMSAHPATPHLIESSVARQPARSIPCRATSPEVALVRPQPQQVAVAPQPPVKPDVSQRLPAVSQPPMQVSPQLPKADHSPAIRQLSPAIRQSSPNVTMPPPPISHSVPNAHFSSSGTSVPINFSSSVAQPSPPVSTQTSELRAVLAQPSRLAQQEQILQQQRLQQHVSTMRLPTPHADHKQAAGVIGLGQHRMPYTIPEPRSAGGRAEPKLPAQSHHIHPQHAVHTGEQTELPSPQPSFTSSQSPVLPKPSQPDVRPGMPPPSDQRPPLPQQYYPPDLRLPAGIPLGSLSLGVPPRGIAIDPRMFPGSQQHAEFLAHQGLGPMLPGMVAPQPPPQALLAAQQGAATEHRETSHQPPPSTNRPPSRHRASPTVQAPPRNTTPHTPGLPTTQMPPPPRHAVDMSSMPSDSMALLLRRYPVLWQGLLNLKNDTSAVQMHFVAGSKQLVDLSLPQMGPDGVGAPLRIAQRMRLEQAQLEGVTKRMESESEFSMLLAIPCGLDHIELLHQNNTLRTGFISYLQQKQAAGIVNVPAPGCTQPAYVVHIFPPCQFSSNNLSQVAPDLLHSVSDMAYLLVIIATVSPN